MPQPNTGRGGVKNPTPAVSWTCMTHGVKTMVPFGTSEVWIGGKDGRIACYTLEEEGMALKRQVELLSQDVITSLQFVKLTSKGQSAKSRSASKSVSYEGYRLWCGGMNGKILVFNVENGRNEYNVIAHNSAVQEMTHVETSSIGSGFGTVWTTSMDWSIKIWDAKNLKALKKISTANSWTKFLIHMPDLDCVWGAGTDKSIYCWRPTGDPQIKCPEEPTNKILSLGSIANSMQFDTATGMVWIVEDKHIGVYDPQNHNVMQLLEESGKDFCFGENHVWVTCNNPYPNTVLAISRKDFTVQHRLESQLWFNSVCNLPPLLVASTATAAKLYLINVEEILNPKPAKEKSSGAQRSRSTGQLGDIHRCDSAPSISGMCSPTGLARKTSATAQTSASSWKATKAKVNSGRVRVRAGTIKAPAAGGKIADVVAQVTATQSTQKIIGTKATQSKPQEATGAANEESSRHSSMRIQITPSSPCSHDYDSYASAGTGEEDSWTMIDPENQKDSIPSDTSPNNQTSAAGADGPMDKPQSSDGGNAKPQQPFKVPSLSWAPKKTAATTTTATTATPIVPPLTWQPKTPITSELKPYVSGQDTKPTDPNKVEFVSIRKPPPMNDMDDKSAPPTATDPSQPAPQAEPKVEFVAIRKREPPSNAENDNPAPAPSTEPSPSSSVETAPDPGPVKKIPFIPKLKITTAMQKSVFMYDDRVLYASFLETAKKEKEEAKALERAKRDAEKAEETKETKEEEKPNDDVVILDEPPLNEPSAEKQNGQGQRKTSLRPPSPINEATEPVTLSNEKGEAETSQAKGTMPVYIPPLQFAVPDRPAKHHRQQSLQLSPVTKLSPGGKIKSPASAKADHSPYRDKELCRHPLSAKGLPTHNEIDTKRKHSLQLPTPFLGTKVDVSGRDTENFDKSSSFTLVSAMPGNMVIPLLEDIESERKKIKDDDAQDSPMMELSHSFNSEASIQPTDYRSSAPKGLTNQNPVSVSVSSPPPIYLSSSHPHHPNYNTPPPPYSSQGRGGGGGRGLALGPYGHQKKGLHRLSRPGSASPGTKGSGSSPIRRGAHSNRGMQRKMSGDCVNLWAESWLDFGWSPADVYWQQQVLHIFASRGYRGLQSIDTRGDGCLSPEGAKQRRELLLEHLRLCMQQNTTTLRHGSPSSHGTELNKSGQTKSSEGSHAVASDLNKIFQNMTRLGREFFPSLLPDGSGSHRSQGSNISPSPSYHSSSSSTTWPAVDPFLAIYQNTDDTDVQSPEAQQMVRLLEIIRDQLTYSHREHVMSTRSNISGTSNNSNQHDVMALLQMELEAAHKREDQFIRQARDGYAQIVQLQSDLRAAQEKQASCALGFSDALLRIGENLDFLALLTGIQETSANKTWVEERGTDLDRDSIKRTTDAMIMRLRLMERKLSASISHRSPTEPPADGSETLTPPG